MAELVQFQYQNDFLNGALQDGECRRSFALGVQLGGANNQMNLANKAIIAFSNFCHTTEGPCVARRVMVDNEDNVSYPQIPMWNMPFLSFGYALEVFLLPV